MDDTEDMVNIIRDDINHRIALMEDEIESTQKNNENLKIENRKIKKELDDLTVQHAMLEKTLFKLRNAPYLYICGENAGLSFTSHTIPYHTILYSSTNTEGGGLDISTGVFQSPFPGTYTVTWSMMADNNKGENIVEVYIRKNKEAVTEALHSSYYTGDYSMGDMGIAKLSPSF